MRVLYIGSTIRPDLTKNNAYFEFLALKKIYRNIELLNCEKFFVMPNITRRIFIIYLQKYLNLF